MHDTLDRPATLRRIADLGPDALVRLEDEIAAYNGGRPLNIAAMADLFGVDKYTIYAWCPAADAVQPSTEYLPTPDDSTGTRLWNPDDVIPWGLEVAKLDWLDPGFARRDFRPLQSPGRNRRTAA